MGNKSLRDENSAQGEISRVFVGVGGFLVSLKTNKTVEYCEI
jgi:hypothetical protein